MGGRAPRVLTVAGSDPGGGAGLQLDLKVFAALGADGAAIPAVLTVQGPDGLRRADPVPAAALADALEAVLGGGEIAAMKTGALGGAAQVEAVADALRGRPDLPLVCDPVLQASRVAHPGAILLDAAGAQALRERLLPRATVLTPNLPEAAALAGRDGPPRELACALLDLGAHAVLLKGGHAAGDARVEDLLATPAGIEGMVRPRLAGARAVHGTGCALSAALAVGLARGLELAAAAVAARDALQGWLERAGTGRLRPGP